MAVRLTCTSVTSKMLAMSVLSNLSDNVKFVLSSFFAAVVAAPFIRTLKQTKRLAFPPGVEQDNQNIDQTGNDGERQPCRQEDPKILCNHDLPRILVEDEEIHTVEAHDKTPR